MWTSAYNAGSYQAQKEVFPVWELRPESSALPQPDYIPEALTQDYYEACLIRNKSPKAAATLARRCLQGMIRDFCDITKNNLYDAIVELEKGVADGRAPKGVQEEHIDAIHAVRKVGNIGAHMEKDIDLIVEVDPDDAQTLIGLIEMLFTEWYVARKKREDRLAPVLEVAQDKEAARLPKPEEVLMIEEQEGEG